jgi:hypothetical protein
LCAEGIGARLHVFSSASASTQVELSIPARVDFEDHRSTGGSEETVKVHVKHLMEKLGASDRTQAVAIAVRRGIIQL